MILARVVGSVVATRKDPRLEGKKLLILKPISPDGKDEAGYVCDACGEEIVVPIDLSAGAEQEYVEDCPVCCRPNVIHVEVYESGEVRAWAEGEAALSYFSVFGDLIRSPDPDIRSCRSSYDSV